MAGLDFIRIFNRMSRSSKPYELKIGAIVLAAGSGSRLGHRPKCLLELNGEPLIQRLLRAITDAHIKNIAVVSGHYAERIKPIVTQFPVALARNPAPDAGQNSSLHVGLRALPRDLDAVLVALADQPLIDSCAIETLIRAYEHRLRTTDVMVPIVNDLPGNPVLFSSAVRDAILARDDTFGCKQWQGENPERVYRWLTDDERYRVDIDTADDIDAFTLRTGVSLRWPSSK